MPMLFVIVCPLAVWLLVATRVVAESVACPTLANQVFQVGAAGSVAHPVAHALHHLLGVPIIVVARCTGSDVMKAALKSELRPRSQLALAVFAYMARAVCVVVARRGVTDGAALRGLVVDIAVRHGRRRQQVVKVDLATRAGRLISPRASNIVVLVE